MKSILKLSTILFLSSCTVNAKNWHESASKIGGQSIYIKEDGEVSAKINDKISDHPQLNIFDAKSADIGYAAMQILYKKHGLEYKNNPDSNSIYILDLRNVRKNFSEYDEIIEKNKSGF